MADVRNALVDGDMTSTGGILIGTGDMWHHGVRVAVEGDVATCPVCKKGGKVFNDCHPAFDLMGKQILVEGARVYCSCAVKPHVFSSQNDFTLEVLRGVPPANRTAEGLGLPTAADKLVEEVAGEQHEASDATCICPNMSNAEFHATMLRLRDKAVQLVGERMAELQRWSNADQIKVERWFGNRAEETRSILQQGLTGIRALLQKLTPEHFERYSVEGLRRVGCVPRPGAETSLSAASVCKPDGTFTIFMRLRFCELPDELTSAAGLPMDGDSRLLVLIHEVSHFPIAMNSEDKWYVTRWSKMKAKMRDQFCIANADNIAGYIVNIGD